MAYPVILLGAGSAALFLPQHAWDTLISNLFRAAVFLSLAVILVLEIENISDEQ